MGVVAEEDIGRRDGYERERRAADRPRGGISGCKGVRGFRGLVGSEICEASEGSEEVILRTRSVPQTPATEKPIHPSEKRTRLGSPVRATLHKERSSSGSSYPGSTAA